MEELDVHLVDGRHVPLLLKNLSRETMLEAGRQARPEFLYEPRREIDAYRRFLSRAGAGTAMYYGSLVDARAARYWLLLERVNGLELRHIGEFDTWEAAARWIGTFHRRFAHRAARLRADREARLVRYDADFLHVWIERARRIVTHAEPRRSRARLEALEWLANRYRRTVDFLAALPATVIHGEFYACNIIVQQTPKGQRICPVDWETLAVAPGLIDLAALTAGVWTEAQKLRLLAAYDAALTGAKSPSRRVPTALRVAFDHCRLHQAVRMLGWPNDAGWAPPPQHAHDWLDDAIRLARRLSR
jgi:thiamine kinase-like enzyme